MDIIDRTGRRPFYWVGSSRSDLKQFPLAIQKDFGVGLFVVQLGALPPGAKPWKGHGPGVFELRARQRGDAFRLVFAIEPSREIFVLHAFQKKSRSGIATPRNDRRLVAQRLRQMRKGNLG
jgi:phage-related protein